MEIYDEDLNIIIIIMEITQGILNCKTLIIIKFK